MDGEDWVVGDGQGNGIYEVMGSEGDLVASVEIGPARCAR